MLAPDYRAYLNYIKKGKLPGHFGSTKSNFKRAAKNMKVNSKGVLLRDGKFVVQRSERDKIFRGNFKGKMHQQI